MTSMHHILIIDDDPDVADAIAEVLDSYGHESRIARDGAAAFDTLEAGFRPCVILCDEMMPAMSGTEFLKKLRRTEGFGSIPVVNLDGRDAVSAASDHCMGLDPVVAGSRHAVFFVVPFHEPRR